MWLKVTRQVKVPDWLDREDPARDAGLMDEQSNLE